jgi:hypothetical protein
MTLPLRLEQYHALLDLVVDAIVHQIEIEQKHTAGNQVEASPTRCVMENWRDDAHERVERAERAGTRAQNRPRPRTVIASRPADVPSQAPWRCRQHGGTAVNQRVVNDVNPKDPGYHDYVTTLIDAGLNDQPLECAK